MNVLEKIKKGLLFFPIPFIILICSYKQAERSIARNPADSIPVFPGAVGFGSMTVAGRGGKIVKVTTLNPSGPGSLDAALNTLGKRVVIFEVSGTIKLTKDLILRNPYITIAGQTAPSPGITVCGGGLAIVTHDVLIQHIRIRVGDAEYGPDKSDRDALKIYNQYKNTYNIVIDHCSFSWSIDENVSIAQAGAKNVSFTNNICSEGLYIAGHPGYPPGTAHSKGMMIGSGVSNVTVYGNLFAHNHQRNIQVGDINTRNIEEVNNLIYNWGSTAADTYGYLNVIGNHFIAGPNTTNESFRVRSEQAQMYTYDNIGGTWWPGCTGTRRPVTKSIIPDSRIMPSSKVYDYVLRNAGARPSDRDSVDQRIIREVQTGTGSFRNSVAEAGGWPDTGLRRRSLSSGIPGAGTMPSSSADKNNNGYTDLEEWLQKLSGGLDRK
jgi:hypothetical protein